jgi:hypothetical protein
MAMAGYRSTLCKQTFQTTGISPPGQSDMSPSIKNAIKSKAQLKLGASGSVGPEGKAANLAAGVKLDKPLTAGGGLTSFGRVEASAQAGTSRGYTVDAFGGTGVAMGVSVGQTDVELFLGAAAALHQNQLSGSGLDVGRLQLGLTAAAIVETGSAEVTVRPEVAVGASSDSGHASYKAVGLSARYTHVSGLDVEARGAYLWSDSANQTPGAKSLQVDLGVAKKLSKHLGWFAEGKLDTAAGKEQGLGVQLVGGLTLEP